MSNERYPGENMSKQQYEEKIRIISQDDLGPGNQGEFGPVSSAESEFINDVGDERYWGPRQEKSACMDDRLEGLRLHLAGNRAITEAAAQYLDRRAEALPLSKNMARTVNQLTVMDRVPVFHKKCAAIASIRQALEYAGEREGAVIGEVWKKLDRLGATEFITMQQLSNAINTGRQNSQVESIWDSTPDQLMKIAEDNGAEIEETPGNHKVAGNLDNMSSQGFNNGLYRSEHTADDGQPMGMLTIDWLGYRDQLAEDGFSDPDIARQLMRSGIFIVAVQKMINKDDSPLVTVGPAA